MKFLVVLALACFAATQAIYAAPSDKVDCSKLEEVLDDLGGAQGVTTLNPKYRLFTNGDEMKVRCAEMTEAIKTLRKYNKECYSALTQQVFSAILRTRLALNELYCKTDSAESKEALEGIKCIQENALEEIKDAERKTILQSQVLHEMNIADEKLRTRRACCAVLDSKTLFNDAAKAKCGKHEKLYSDYVDSYTSEAMGLICPEADKLDCKSLEALKIAGVAPKNTFFLAPMLRLIKTLDH